MYLKDKIHKKKQIITEEEYDFSNTRYIKNNDGSWMVGDRLSAYSRELYGLDKGANVNKALERALNLSSYQAFCANINSDSLDAAFGKNNEDRVSGLGLQLAMYARFKDPTINIEKVFPNLIMCNTLDDINNNTNALLNIISNNNLYNFIKSNNFANSKIFSGDYYTRIVHILCDKIGIKKVDTLEQVFVNKENSLAMFNEPMFLTVFNIVDYALLDATKSIYALWTWCSNKSYMSGRSINYSAVSKNTLSILDVLEEGVVEGLFKKSNTSNQWRYDAQKDELIGYINMTQVRRNGTYVGVHMSNIAGGGIILSLPRGSASLWDGNCIFLHGALYSITDQSDGNGIVAFTSYTRIP